MVWKGGRGENGGEEPRAPDCRQRSTRRSGSPPGSRPGIAPARGSSAVRLPVRAGVRADVPVLGRALAEMLPVLAEVFIYHRVVLVFHLDVLDDADILQGAGHRLALVEQVDCLALSLGLR